MSEKRETTGGQDEVKLSLNRARWQNLLGRRILCSSLVQPLEDVHCERAALPTRDASARAAHGTGSHRRWVAKRPEATGLLRGVDVARAADRRVGVLSCSNRAKPQRGSAHLARMQQHADLARLCRRSPIPLTLLAQSTGTTTADAGGIHHAQAAIGFRAPFVNRKGLIGRTAQRAIGLESEVLPGEAANFEGGSHGGLAIAMGKGLLLGGAGHRRSKLGDPDRIRMELMPQLEEPRSTPIARSPASTPAPRLSGCTSESLVEFLILIGKRRFKGAAM